MEHSLACLAPSTCRAIANQARGLRCLVKKEIRKGGLFPISNRPGFLIFPLRKAAKRSPRLAERSKFCPERSNSTDGFCLGEEKSRQQISLVQACFSQTAQTIRERSPRTSACAAYWPLEAAHLPKKISARHVHFVRGAPHYRLFPHMHAIIHHGGAPEPPRHLFEPASQWQFVRSSAISRSGQGGCWNSASGRLHSTVENCPLRPSHQQSQPRTTAYAAQG